MTMLSHDDTQTIPAPAESRDRCILFADVAGSTRLYEKLGNTEARHAVERCLKRARLAVEACRGTVIKSIGDAILAVFDAADDCLQAACQMQQRVVDLPRVAGQALEIRVGFHYGPVIEENGDVFGDAVNLAARLADVAKASKIIASASTVALLPPLARAGTRELPPAQVKGKSDPVRICEVLWQSEGELTMLQPAPLPLAPAPPKPVEVPRAILRLRHAGTELALAANWDVLRFGRDKACDIAIADPMASRQHARIERRGANMVLIDQSTNGTWIAVHGEAERRIGREELVLAGIGRLSFGHPWREGMEVVEYAVE